MIIPIVKQYIKLSRNTCMHKKLTIPIMYIYCQNPNLTTTQPQPNLNLVGFDTIITLHPPTPPHPTTQTLLLPEIMILGI